MILLGLGFTTCRLAHRLLVHNQEVYGVSRGIDRFRGLRAIGLRTSAFDAACLPRHSTIVHSIPPLTGTDAAWLHAFIEELEPRRIVYISATSVYGDQVEVDERTQAVPAGEKSLARYEEEQWLRQGQWSNLVIRPAAIYGPGRGVHEKIREGKLPRGAAAGIVSRIHVDDLAAVLEAGVFSDLEGAWPLADDYPCASEEIARFCATLLRVKPKAGSWATFPVAGRRVDGRRIRDLLGVSLLYPDYESGVMASVSEANSHGARQRDPA